MTWVDLKTPKRVETETPDGREALLVELVESAREMRAHAEQFPSDALCCAEADTHRYWESTFEQMLKPVTAQPDPASPAPTPGLDTECVHEVRSDREGMPERTCCKCGHDFFAKPSPGLAQDGARETLEQYKIRQLQDVIRMMRERAERAESALAQMEQERDHLCAELSKRDTDVNECAGWLEQARTALARVTQERDHLSATCDVVIDEKIEAQAQRDEARQERDGLAHTLDVVDRALLTVCPDAHYPETTAQYREAVLGIESRTWDAAERVVQQAMKQIVTGDDARAVCAHIMFGLRAARTPTTTSEQA